MSAMDCWIEERSARKEEDKYLHHCKAKCLLTLKVRAGHSKALYRHVGLQVLST